MEEPRTETDVRSVVGNEEEHHEKKPMMTRMKNRMRKMKDSMTKKMHGHVDDHDVHDDDEHSVEAEAEHIDHGIQDSPVTLASRDQDVPLDGLGSRDERPDSLSNREERTTLGGLQEPPVTPEIIKDTALDADPVDPLRNRSVSRTEDGNVSDPEIGNERSVSPDVLSHFRDMDISSDVEKKPSYTEDPSTTAAEVKEVEEKPSYTEKLPTTAVAVKDAAVYAKMVGGAHSGEANDQIVTPENIGHGEGAEEEKGTYSEKLSASPVAAKDATLSAAASSAVYAKVAGGIDSGETHVQIANPGSIGHGVEVEPRVDAEEEKGSYTEKLPATLVAAKDGKMVGDTHSREANDQIATPGSTETGAEVEAREGDEEEKGSYTENLPATHVPTKDAAVSAASAVHAKVAGDDQIATPGSTRPAVEVEPREEGAVEVEPREEGAEEEKGSYIEELPAAVAAKDAAEDAASTVYAEVADDTHSGETHDQIATPGSTGHGEEVEPREIAGEEKESYTEKLPATVLAAKDAVVSAASTVYAKVAEGTHSGETHDQIATPVRTEPDVEVQPREGAEEENRSYTEKLPATAITAKDAVVSAASTVYAKVAGDTTHSGETHDQIATPVSTEPGVEVEPIEGGGEKEETYMEQFTGAAWAVYGKMMGAGTAGDGTEQEISESMKTKGVEEHEVVEDKEGEVKGRIVLPEVTAGEIGVKRVVGTEGGGDGGKGMMGMFNRAVDSMVGGDGGSGGQAAAAEGADGGAEKGRAHE